MPNYGRSGRCLTCKRRHVKCDEARPACSPCRRLGLDCGGYNKSYAFRKDESHKFAFKKDESHKFASVATSKKILTEQQGSLVHCSPVAEQPSQSLLTRADIAVPFFLMHHAGMGRSLAIARGFYETLIPVYTSQPYNSPLSLAVSAVAARIFSFWRHDDAAQVEAYSVPYNQAIASLRCALERTEDRDNPAITLAILALHLYESISAVFDARKATPVHHHGALSLLQNAALDSSHDLIGTNVKGFVLHTEISSALRQKRSLHPYASSYISRRHTSFLLPANFSSTLDSIGACVVELQADYVRGLSQLPTPGLLLEQQCRAWITEAGRINDLLQAWTKNVPDYWRPLRFTSGQDLNPSITAYQSTCDVYASCPIATLYNLWRFHRLLLLKITVGATRISNLQWSESVDEEWLTPTTWTSAIQAASVQELVDSICYSIPFYLGNRTKQSSLNDFTDPEILFPSCHSLGLGDARIPARPQDCDDVTLSVDEHKRHMLAYGAWHSVSPLSNLLTLVSDEHGGRLIARCLRPGQLEWIREQFLRVSTLLRLPASKSFDGSTSLSPSLSPVGPTSTDNAAESLAKQVRQGAIFMSGP